MGTKKARDAFIWVLFVLTILYPAANILLSFLGYRLVLKSMQVFFAVIAAVSLGILILDSKCEEAPENKMLRIFLAIITLLSLLNLICVIIVSPGFLSLICGFFSVGCCCVLSIKYGKPKALKITALVLSALLILPVGGLGFVSLIFYDFGEETVLQRADSPTGKYYAELIADDQGALGGSTRVCVYKNNAGFDAFFFKIEAKPHTVYSGSWGEFHDLTLSWKDDYIIKINAKEYRIK